MAGSSNKIFVGGLPQGIDDQTFQEYFEKYGSTTDVVVMKDSATGNTRGFGFVTYTDTSAVDAVMENYKDHQINGKWVEVKRATPKGDGAGGKGGGGGKAEEVVAKVASQVTGHAQAAATMYGVQKMSAVDARRPGHQRVVAEADLVELTHSLHMVVLLSIALLQHMAHLQHMVHMVRQPHMAHLQLMVLLLLMGKHNQRMVLRQ